MTAATTLAGLWSYSSTTLANRASELCNRERHSSEKCAGGIGIINRRTLLIGNAVIGCAYEKLCGTHHPNYREDTEGCVNLRALAVGDDIFAEDLDYRLGNINVFGAGALAGTVTVNDLGVENNRVNGFCFCHS